MGERGLIHSEQRGRTGGAGEWGSRAKGNTAGMLSLIAILFTVLLA